MAAAAGTGNDLLPDIPVAAINVRLTPLVQLAGPVIDLAHAGDGSGRLFLVQPAGTVRVWQTGSLLPTPFLSAPAFPPDRAMSSLAFHPQFPANGKLYVLTGEASVPGAADYDPPQDDIATHFDNLLVEYQVAAANPDEVDPATGRELLRVHQADKVHNVNDMCFGPDGYLHLAVGDGGDTRTGTPTHFNVNAGDPDLPYGKFLRIDVDTLGGNGRYGIPADNPFPTGAVPELYAWGVRNPWRINKDRFTGGLYSAVNGELTIEYLVRVERGANYGWDRREGTFLWSPATGAATAGPPDPGQTAPIAQYDHNGAKAFGSIIGGEVYRGAALRGLCGRYIAFDYVAAEVLAIDVSTGAIQRIPFDPAGAALAPFRDITLNADEAGELYVGGATGLVLRLDPGGNMVAGDLDGDALVRDADLSLWLACHAGPMAGAPAGCDPCLFAQSDMTADADVDMTDLAALQRGVQ